MSFSIDMTKYVHEYEAYRIPKGSKIISPEGKEDILVEDQLVLTEASQKQLIEDRIDFGSELLSERRKMDAERHAEAEKKYAEDQTKMIAVFRSMSEGKIVSDTDEKKLMEYDPKLYMAAKMAQMISQKNEKEKEKHFNESEEKEYREKIEKYNTKADELNVMFNEEFKTFVEKQKKSITEVMNEDLRIDIVSRVVNLGGGIMGSIIDTTI